MELLRASTRTSCLSTRLTCLTRVRPAPITHRAQPTPHLGPQLTELLPSPPPFSRDLQLPSRRSYLLSLHRMYSPITPSPLTLQPLGYDSLIPPLTHSTLTTQRTPSNPLGPTPMVATGSRRLRHPNHQHLPRSTDIANTPTRMKTLTARVPTTLWAQMKTLLVLTLPRLPRQISKNHSTMCSRRTDSLRWPSFWDSLDLIRSWMKPVSHKFIILGCQGEPIES